MSARRPLRIGVAGLGFGAAVHVPGFRAVPDVEVAALAGSTVERARVAADRLGVPKAVGDALDLVDMDLDAVSLALPPDRQPRVAAAALARGMAVLCEKPLADTLDAAASLAARAARYVTAVDFQFAELATFRALHGILASGRLGAVRSVQVVWLSQSFAHSRRAWSWKLEDGRGGALNLLGSHLLYLAELLFGPATEASAMLDRRATCALAPEGAAPADDLVQLRLRLGGGVALLATISNACPGLATHCWTVACERGTAVLSNTSRDHMGGFSLTIFPAEGPPEAPIGEPAAHGDGRLPPFVRLAERFAEAVRSGTPMRPDFAAGLRVQELIEAVRRSAARMAPIAVSSSA